MAESTSPLPPSNRNTKRGTNYESEIDDRDIFDTPREEIDVGNSIERNKRDEQTNGNDTSRSGTSQMNGNDISRSRNSQINGNNISRSRNSQINDNDTSRSRNSQINENDTSRSRNSQINGNDIARSRNSQINENDTSRSRNSQINENETSQSKTSQINENDTSRSRNSQIKENDTSRSRTSQSNGNDTSRSRNSLINENDISPSRSSPTKPRVIDSETKYTVGEDNSHRNNLKIQIKMEKIEEILNGDNTTRSNQNNKKDETGKSQDGEDENEITNTKKVEKENESVSDDGNINNNSNHPTFSEIQKANDDSLKSPSREPITNNNVTSSASEKHSDSDRYTDSETTGGKSSLSEHTPRSQTKKSKKKPKRSSKSPKPTKSKSILKTEESKPHKPLAFMSSLLEDGTTPRNPTRDSGDSTVVSLPAINRQNVINKVYVDDTEKIVNKYPKRDKDFKLEFVYDLRPKYPSWYAPEKRLSRREEKVFSDMSGVYADYKQQDERHLSKTKTMDDRLKKLEKLKREEIKEKKRKKLEAAYEQYEQLKDVREKFDIMCWYRNHTQYITPRVLEHEKLSRHVYGLPESLKEQQKLIKNLKRKPKKRTKNGNRIDSH
ncbi:unnamed protein product [Mytilus edulis]|uniref:Uncharacterized protein n=1 Tax=Mytilus edulis TaxID=6550 RepID=A0A8S3QI83_MYTED|nr:unnamed protein product [Mytilus edulis]